MLTIFRAFINNKYTKRGKMLKMKHKSTWGCLIHNKKGEAKNVMGFDEKILDLWIIHHVELQLK